MQNGVVYFLKGTNNDVIDFYFSMIEKSFVVNHREIVYTTSLNDLFQLHRSTLIFVAELRHSIPLILRGYFNIIYWSQGVTPEEDYLRKKSRLRLYVLRLCEYLTLRVSKFNLFVSDRMLEHYEKTYKLRLRKKSFVMPCFNVDGLDTYNLCEERYNHNVFCYVGSLAAWQCFPETVELYKKIEATVPDAFLKVYTSDQKTAKDYLKQAGIKNYSVGFVTQDKLPLALSNCKFGFIIRDDILVNNVATPTKMSTYLSCGVIPIFSDCISAFKEHFSHYKYFIPVSANSYAEVKDKLCQKIDVSSLSQEYQYVFQSYYNTQYYIAEISKRLRILL